MTCLCSRCNIIGESVVGKDIVDEHIALTSDLSEFY